MCQGLDRVNKDFMLHFLFSRLLHYLFWIRYNVKWNVNVVINEAMKENIYCIDKFITQDRSCLESVRRLSLFLCQKSNIRMVEEVVPLPFLCNIWRANIFFACHLFLMEWPLQNMEWPLWNKVKWFSFRFTKNLNHPILLTTSGRTQG